MIVKERDIVSDFHVDVSHYHVAFCIRDLGVDGQTFPIEVENMRQAIEHEVYGEQKYADTVAEPCSFRHL